MIQILAESHLSSRLLLTIYPVIISFFFTIFSTFSKYVLLHRSCLVVAYSTPKMPIAAITGKLRRKIWTDLGTSLGLGISSAYAYWSVLQTSCRSSTRGSNNLLSSLFIVYLLRTRAYILFPILGTFTIFPLVSLAVPGRDRSRC